MDISLSNTLLLVDSEEFVLRELEHFFTRHQYRCVATSCPTQAATLFLQNPDICIVLTSLSFPNQSGLELLATLNADKSPNRSYEAIILTGDDNKSDIIQAMRSGVTDCYQKPLDLDELLQGVKRLEQRLLKQSHDKQLTVLNQKIKNLTHSLNEIYSDINNIRKTTSSFHSETVHQSVAQSEPVPAFDKLSPRQFAVAKLIAQGMTNAQISVELSITENTVKLYVSQILRITHLKNRTQLALSFPVNCTTPSSHAPL